MPTPALNLKGVTFENLIDPNAPAPPMQAPPAEPTVVPPSPPASQTPPQPAAPPSPPPPADDPNKPADQNKDNADKDVKETPLTIFKQELGYEVDGDFEDNLDGLLDYTRSAIPVAAKQLVNEIFEAYPQAQQLIEHLRKGNSIDTFIMQFQSPESVSIQVDDKTDFKVLESIVKQDMEERGYSKEDVDAILNLSKEQNNLLTRAKAAQKSIESRFQSQIEAKKQAELDQIANAEREAKETAQKIESIISSGRLPNTVIPDTDKKAFADFIMSVNESGENPRDLAWKNMSIEEMLYLDYLVFKGSTKSKNSGDSSKKFIYDELLGSRSTRRMDGSGEKPKASSSANNPKNSLQNIQFKDLLT